MPKDKTRSDREVDDTVRPRKEYDYRLQAHRRAESLVSVGDTPGCVDADLAALRVRARAALELRRLDEVDGALELVVSPTEELEAASRRAGTRERWGDDRKQLARELAAQGQSQRQIAITIFGAARYRPTIATWLRQRSPAEQGMSTTASRPAS